MLKKTKDVADQNSYALDQQYQGMLDNAVEAIIIIDSKGLIQFANKATTKLFGWTTAQLIGKNVSLLMPSRFATKHDGYLKNYTDTGKAQIIGIGREVEGLKKNGTTFPMHLSVSEFIWNGEKLYSGFVHDLTQSKAAEKLLQKTAAINALLHHTAESANAATSVDSAIAACLKDV